MRTILVLFGMAATLCAASHDWGRLSDLRPGDRLRVILDGGGEQTGSFQAVTAEALTLQSTNAPARIERARVRRVIVLSRSHRLRNGLIGAGIGFAIGLTMDKTLGAYLNNEGQYTAGGRALVYGVPIGLFGGIGAAIGGHPTIYQAK